MIGFKRGRCKENENVKELEVQHNIFNKLKKTTPDTNLSELNNKIDTLVTMMGKIVLLLEKKEKLLWNLLHEK